MPKIKSISLILGVLIMSFLIGYLVLAWTEPSVAPPGCLAGQPGCDAPINAGPTDQTKQGALIIGGGVTAPVFKDSGDTTYFIDPAGQAVTNYSAILKGNVGIGTTEPNAKLHVADGSVLFSGNIGGTPVSGAGRRLMWIPANGGAFRVGYVSGTQWDDANIGSYSVAMGVDPLASGYSSIALGYNSSATGYESAALGGWSPIASGDYSLAFGYGPIASGNYSLAFGRWVTAGPSAHTYVLGQGVEFDARLVNNVTSSLMVGFNSNIPTLFVGPSSGVGTTGNVGIGTTSPTSKLQVVGLPEYADNAAAIAGGLTIGAFYRTGDILKVVH